MGEEREEREGKATGRGRLVGHVEECLDVEVEEREPCGASTGVLVVWL